MRLFIFKKNGLRKISRAGALFSFCLCWFLWRLCCTEWHSWPPHLDSLAWRTASPQYPPGTGIFNQVLFWFLNWRNTPPYTGGCLCLGITSNTSMCSGISGFREACWDRLHSSEPWRLISTRYPLRKRGPHVCVSLPRVVSSQCAFRLWTSPNLWYFSSLSKSE